MQKSSAYKVFVTISPSENDFKNSFQDLIVKFEQTAGIEKKIGQILLFLI